MRILNLGSLNYDFVYTVPHIAMAGETLSSEGMQVFIGGKGLNQSIALARAGVDVCHGGMVGEDGDELIEFCQKNHVQTQHICKINGKSGHTIIQVDSKAQNCIILFGGANRSITKDYVDEVLSQFGKGDFLLLQNEINLLDYIIEKAASREIKIILNPSPYNEEVEKCDLSKIALFLLNEIEGEQMTKEKDPDQILQVMQDKFPKAKVVLTLGEKGVCYFDGNSIWKQDIYKVKAVDTTAAGDTFTGYFIAGLINQSEPQEILKRSAMASAIAVSRKGAAPSIPTKEEIDILYNERIV